MNALIALAKFLRRILSLHDSKNYLPRPPLTRILGGNFSL
jgi:hypothetical protein